jgi:gliding motility-associated-like protein
VIDVTGSSPGTYEVFYALTENCITNFFNDTIVISSASNSNTSISASACSSYTAPWGTVYTQSGTYKDTLTNVSGCDSIISVNLTITGTIITPSITASACSSYTASWGTVYTQTGIYRDTLTSVNGCDSIISVNLTITGTIITPPIIASACTSYSAPWGTVYTQSGTYTDTLTSVNGCDSIVSVNLTITGTIITPTITASACTSYTAPWGTVYTQSGTYRDTLSTVNGCDSIVSVNLTVLGNVIAPTLTASACSTYTAPWGAVYSQSGTYRDTLSAANGCDSIVSVNLTINNLPSLSASSNPDICGRKTGTASANASSGSGGYIYAWSTGVSGSSLINVGSGVYTVTVTDQRGCSASTSITVGNIPPPLVNVTSSSSPIILEGDSVQLNATGALSFLWSPAIGLSCTACPSTVASPPQTTTYIVTAADTNGCIGSDSITVRVDIRCDELFVPSVFSPNNAGPAINERVCIFSNCIAEMNFAIYNRWGQLIFQTSDPLQCWDGTKDGKEMISGVYVYRLSVKQLNGISITKNGNITLIR